MVANAGRFAGVPVHPDQQAGGLHGMVEMVGVRGDLIEGWRPASVSRTPRDVTHDRSISSCLIE